MNTRLTWLLFLVATALGGYVAFTELGREDGQLRNRGGAEVRFSPILARDVTAVELLRSNTVVRVERQGEAWAMKLPVAYPGLGSAIDTFLENLAKVTPSRWLSAAELAAGGTTNLQQAFGFEGGSVTIKLETSAGRRSANSFTCNARAPKAFSWWPTACSRACRAPRITGVTAAC
jgi:hypothetical protein